MNTVEVYGKSFQIGEVYQPIYGQPETGERACDDRFRTIWMSDIMFNSNRLLESSVADIGCNLGYFLFKLSEVNSRELVGIDRDGDVIAIANHIKQHKGIENVTFEQVTASAQELPKAETYLIFSILHHLMTRAEFDDSLFLRTAAEHASTIYIELATHLEWPNWASKLFVEGNPYLYWMRELDRITGGEFVIRLVGMHKTHLNTVRPMYQLKRKIHETLLVGKNSEYEVYDKWTTPYRGFQACVLGSSEVFHGLTIKTTSEYRYAICDGKEWFIKKEDGLLTITPKFEGLLLSDIIKFSMLHFYDVVKIVQQLTEWANGNQVHTDANPWNFLVTEDSELVAIDDAEDGRVSNFGGDVATSKKLSGLLMNLLY